MLVSDLPKEIQGVALLRHKEQRDKINFTGGLGGIFTWSDTSEGHKFWQKINNGNFDVFYTKYPKMEPKQEQYYTSIPTDVKVGEKFQIIGGKGIGCGAYNLEWEIGSVVSLDFNDDSTTPRFELKKGDMLWLDWGWLKPIKDDDYKVGDWVLLVDKRGSRWSNMGKMDKYVGTIRQIRTVREDDKFYLENCKMDAGGYWTFYKPDFVKKVDAPSNYVPLVPSEIWTVKSDQQFNVGDEVEVINSSSPIILLVATGTKAIVIESDRKDFIKIQCPTQPQYCKPEQIKLINKSNNNGKVHSNNNPTGNQSISLHGIPASILCGTTPRGKTISCPRAKIKLGY